jgi:uncharacterized membrane protein
MAEFSGVAQAFDLSVSVLYYLRATGSFLLIFIIPGLVWTLVIFRKLHIMERIVLSFGLSIAIVTLIVLAPNRAMGVPVTATNALISVVAVTGVALLLYALRKFQESRARNK